MTHRSSLTAASAYAGKARGMASIVMTVFPSVWRPPSTAETLSRRPVRIPAESPARGWFVVRAVQEITLIVGVVNAGNCLYRGCAAGSTQGR